MKKFALIIIFLILFSFKISPVSASSFVQTSAMSFITQCDYAIGNDITCPSVMASDGENYAMISTSSASSRKMFFDVSYIQANASIDSIDIDIKSRNAYGSIYMKVLGYNTSYGWGNGCNGSSAHGFTKTYAVDSTTGSSYVYDTFHILPTTTGDAVNCGGGNTYPSISSYIDAGDDWTYTTSSVGADGYPVNAVPKGKIAVVLYCSGTNCGVDIDDVLLSVNYRYDETPYIVGVKSLVLSGVSGNIMATGDDVLGTYYTTATSTYSKVVLDLYDYQANPNAEGHIRLEQSAPVIDTVGASYGFFNVESMGLTSGHRYTYYTRLYSPTLGSYTDPFPNNYSSFCYISCGTSTDYSTTTPVFSTTTNPFATTSNPFNYSTSTTSYFSTSLIFDSQTVLNARMYCNFISYPALFDFGNCIYYMLIPDSSDFSRFFSAFKDSVLARVPFLGGFFLTTSSNLPVINATVPNGVAGAGSTISLDFNHSLDWLLNSTSTKFNNSSASSTQTLFQITYPYWKIFIYFGFALYVLSRVFSSSIFGGGLGAVGTVARMSEQEKKNAVEVYKKYLNRKK